MIKREMFEREKLDLLCQALTYNGVIDTIAKGINKCVWKIHLPSKPVVSLLSFFERIRIPFPIKAEQVLWLASHENKDFSHAEAQRDFGFCPLSFEEGMELELN